MAASLSECCKLDALHGYRSAQVSERSVWHDVGDQALIAFAEVLKQSLPEHALVARFGGDEFVVFLPAHPSDAFALSETLKKAARERDLAKLGVAINVGIATTRGEQS